LIDTGAILAIVDVEDEWHSACVQALSSLPSPLLTSEAVLTETFHLVGSRSHNIEQVWNFVRSGAVALQPIADSELPEVRALMARYHDRPMDFADATLVHLANRESVSLILTIDHDDFETYRIAGRKRFSILPHRSRT